MFLLKLLRPKKIFQLLWFGFGAAGLYLIITKYYPNFPKNLTQTGLIKGIQGEADYSGEELTLENLRELDPQTASQVLGETIKNEITKIIEVTTTEVRQFPQKQVRKIKIGACEELLEEDICSVAKEIQCE